MNLFEASNPWEWLAGLLLWALWGVALVGALIFIFAVLVGLTNGVVNIFRHLRKQRERGKRIL